jgi:hypothetical protein
MAGIITENNRLGGVPQSASRYVAMSTCFDVFLEGTYHIGFISQLTIGHTRTVTQIRHLNSADAGIAVDTVVTPDTITLSFNGFYVYSQTKKVPSGYLGETGVDALNTATGTPLAAGSIGVGPSIGRLAGINLLMTLDQQNIPIDIVVRHSSPSTPGARITNPESGQIIGVYKNCTISAMSIPINVGTAAITDSGTMSVGYVSSGYGA